MELKYSEAFQEELNRITHPITVMRIIKQTRKLLINPLAGKPLRYHLRNHRTLRVSPYRIIYHLEGDCIIIDCFDHRGDVYC